MVEMCQTVISVVGLREPPNIFVEALSKAMFDRCNVLSLHKPFVKCGVSLPRFYAETKSGPPREELKEVSKIYPDLLFHADYFVEPDQSGELVVKGGHLLEQVESGEGWYLFDEIRFRRMSLLPKHMPWTLAQRGAAAVDDAIQLIKRLHRTVNAPAFVDARYSKLRDQRKADETQQTLEILLIYMEECAESLTFDGVFIADVAISETNITAVANETPDSPKASRTPADPAQ